jgi:pimeloyl-ACP methyl ester carboxylesterase
MLSDTQAAELGLLVWYAALMYESDRAALAPPVDPRLQHFRVVGYLTATDCLFRKGQSVVLWQKTCYGYLAQQIDNPSVYVAAIRGTDSLLGWIDDAKFSVVTHPVAGFVEAGFWGIYRSMQYRSLRPGTMPAPAAQGIAAAVGAGELIVLGHSLGSPLATYLTFDLAAELGERVQAVLFASPRPGDRKFVTAFDSLAQYQLWNYELDVVPRVPRGPDYTDLPRVNWIGIEAAKAQIGFTLACHHHILSYLSMLDYDLYDWQALKDPCVACIKGPAAHTAAA